jgi:Phytanoyl-CoA dioxygenase (PhyH)/SEC-C motif
MALTTGIPVQACFARGDNPSAPHVRPLPDESIIAVSADERASGRLDAEVERGTLAAFRAHGCVVLRGALAPALIDAMQADYMARYGALDASAMLQRAMLPPPNPVIARGEGRFQITPRMSGAFAAPGIFASPLLRRVLAQMIGEDLQLSSLTLVVSHPGASLQAVHRDFGHLFGEPGVAANLPPHAVNVVVPLLDVDLATGPTGVWPGSQAWPENGRAQPDTMAACAMQPSDCMLVDYRTLHAGLPNLSSRARPILYMVYARSWFFDDANHFGTTALDLSLEEHRLLPASAHPLLIRALSQAMRSQPPRDLARAANDPRAKVGRNDPCPCGSSKKFKHCHGRSA